MLGELRARPNKIKARQGVSCYTHATTIMLLCSVAGKVAVGLASHWPCVTDPVVEYTCLGLNGLGKGDEHTAVEHLDT